MPSTSPKQHHFMEAIAHDSKFARRAGVPQKVGRDFARADGDMSLGRSSGRSRKSRTESHPQSHDEFMKLGS